MKSRQERLSEYARLRALLPAVEAELKRYPGVQSVGVGLKESANRPTQEIVFRVYVDQKKPPAELSRGEMIPKAVQGVPTDVITLPRPKLVGEDSDKYRPLMGGIRIGNDTTSQGGTLGCIAQLDSDGSIVALSCEHVMLVGGAAIGEKIGQPHISCCCCCKGNIIGQVIDARNDTSVDCAIARITGNPGFTNEIHEIGMIFGAAPLNAEGSTVAPGDPVRKRGKTTRLTSGTVTDPDFAPPGNIHQILIAPDPEHPRFCYYGDSGSAVVNAQNQVVGLLYAMDGGETLGFANIITNVTSALHITIINTGTAGTVPLGSVQIADEEQPIVVDTTPLDVIADALRQTKRGREALAFVDAHGSEINDLLNSNRHVKVAWHRFHGPSFTAHVLQSAREPRHRIPREIEGVSSANLLIRMSVVLQEQGSPALRDAVERETVGMLNLVAGATTAGELLERIGQRDAVPVPVEVEVAVPVV